MDKGYPHSYHVEDPICVVERPIPLGKVTLQAPNWPQQSEDSRCAARPQAGRDVARAVGGSVMGSERPNGMGNSGPGPVQRLKSGSRLGPRAASQRSCTVG